MHDGLSKTCDTYVEAFEHAQQNPIKSKGGVYLTGVDLGTAYIVLVVLDENKKIVAGAHRHASVIRDGMVVDYMGAIQIVRDLKKKSRRTIRCRTLIRSGSYSTWDGCLRWWRH